MSQVVAIDVETTGFGKSDRVVEIGLVIYDLDSSQIVGQLETLLNPTGGTAGRNTKMRKAMERTKKFQGVFGVTTINQVELLVEIQKCAKPWSCNCLSSGLCNKIQVVTFLTKFLS
jgi:hypothetical protein